MGKEHRLIDVQLTIMGDVLFEMRVPPSSEWAHYLAKIDTEKKSLTVYKDGVAQYQMPFEATERPR